MLSKGLLYFFWELFFCAASNQASLNTCRSKLHLPAFWNSMWCLVFGVPFFCGSRQNYQITEGSVKVLLTKNSASSFSCPSCQSRGPSFKRFPRPWQTVGPVSGPFNGPESSLRHAWNTTRRRRRVFGVSSETKYVLEL